MQAVTITQITPSELGAMIADTVRDTMQRFLPEKQQQSNRLMSIDQAAEMLRLAKQTIYCRVSAGTIPAHKRGKRLYFFENELRDWLQQGRKQTINDYAEQANTFLSSK